MLQFEINHVQCTQCGLCAKDCPARIIDLHSGYPKIAAEKERECYKCLHCFAICPHAALSICGMHPEDALELQGNMPDPDALETLIRGRRSVRFYKDEDLQPELLQRLLNVSWQAPTGINSRQVRFTVIDNREALAAFREKTYDGLLDLVSRGKLPQNKKFFADIARLWEGKQVDIIFRGAPHFVVASAPAECASPIPDCLIALSYFELFAQSLGVGTVWNGLAKWAIDELVPELRAELDLPEDHLFGYAMAFGFPDVSHVRTIDHGPANIVRYQAKT